MREILVEIPLEVGSGSSTARYLLGRLVWRRAYLMMVVLPVCRGPKSVMSRAGSSENRSTTVATVARSNPAMKAGYSPEQDYSRG